jgi:hypothetical protein
VLERVRATVGSLRGGEAHWAVDREDGGVLVRQWGFVADVGQALRALGDALSDRGVEGRMVVTRPRSSVHLV